MVTAVPGRALCCGVTHSASVHLLGKVDETVEASVVPLEARASQCCGNSSPGCVIECPCDGVVEAVEAAEGHTAVHLLDATAVTAAVSVVVAAILFIIINSIPIIAL